MGFISSFLPSSEEELILPGPSAGRAAEQLLTLLLPQSGRDCNLDWMPESQCPASGNCFPSTLFMLPLPSGHSGVQKCHRVFVWSNVVNRGQTLVLCVEFESTFLTIILDWLVRKAVTLSQWSVVRSYPT